MEVVIDFITGRKFFFDSQFDTSVNLYKDFSSLLCIILIVSIVRKVMLHICTKFGLFLARSFLTKEYVEDPLNKLRWVNLGKQLWKVFLHGTITLFAWYQFHNEEWWFRDFTPIWEKRVPTSISEKWWSLIEIAYHIIGIFAVYYEKDRKDRMAFFIHHTCTCSLSIGGYISGYNLIGMMCTQVHDVSDVYLSLAKILNHLKLQNLVIVGAIVNLISWIYYRLYLFPVFLIWSTIMDGWFKIGSYFALFLSIFLFALLALHWYWLFLILDSYKRLIVSLKLKGKMSDNCDTQEKDEDVNDYRKDK